MAWLTERLNSVRYRVAGLPISLRYLAHPRTNSPSDVLRHVYARRYWRIGSVTDACELLVTIISAPILLLGAAIWHTARCATVHARRSGRPAVLQLFDQIRLYLASGVMPATYYIFSLHEQPTAARARSFLKRAETKGLIYNIVRERMRPLSSLSDKGAFERRCRVAGLPIVPTIAIARGGMIEGEDSLPSADLFIKPLDGKGGRGAERWEWIGSGRFRSSRQETLGSGELLEHVRRRSIREPLIVQPRMFNHPSLGDLNGGALATIRLLTCLNSKGEPEVIGAALRMAVRNGSIVDNLHNGGIASIVDIETGELGAATNLGKDASIGWLDRHPATDAAIAGRRLEWWPCVRDLGVRAHLAFRDRLFVGWDIAMTPDGPVIVEGNGSPGLDLFQRPARAGMMDGRFVELLAERMRDWNLCDRCAA